MECIIKNKLSDTDINDILLLFTIWHNNLKFIPYNNIISFLYYDSKKLIGMGFLSIYLRTPSIDCLTGKLGELCSVYVLPEYRYNGIASLIVKNIIQKGKELKLDYIHIDSLNTASNIYIKQGFKYQSDTECRLWYSYT